jgi:parallel beta-helix repeat protein
MWTGADSESNAPSRSVSRAQGRQIDRSRPYLFVSYAHEDEEAVRREIQRMEGFGWQVYFDDKIEVGEEWNEELPEAVAGCACFIAIVSASSLNSRYVRKELQFASMQDRPTLSIELEQVDKPATLQWLLDSRQQLFKWQLNDDIYEGRLRTFLNQLPAATSGPTAPAEADTAQRTLLVDPGAGPFKTINLALAEAAPGDRVVVRPGIYKESIVIDKKIELYGDGPRGAIMLQAKKSHTVVFRASEGRLQNLTVIQMSSSKKKYLSAVWVERGSLAVDESILRSDSGPCVVVGPDASAMIRGNTIHSSSSTGIVVNGSPSVTIQANEFVRNLAGIELRNQGHASIQGNQIRGDFGSKLSKQGSGIVVHQQSHGIFEMNEICNYRLGVEVVGGSSPTVRKNEIHDNEVGVDLHDGGNGIFKSNKIFNQKESGVRIRQASTGTFEDNTIRYSGANGIDVDAGGSGSFVNNTVHENQAFGIRVGLGSGTFRGMHLYENKKGPDWIDKRSKAQIIWHN